MKKIIKTSQQAQTERANIQKDSTCPSCNNTLNIGSIRTQKLGLFKPTTETKCYSCYKCGCQWEC